MPAQRLLRWLEVRRSTFHSWCERYGQANAHNGLQPRDFWLQPWERGRIIAYYGAHSRDGYRRLAFMMLDEHIVAVSPSTTWRILRGAGLLRQWNGKVSKKRTGFHQPLLPHEHWHIDMSYVDISGTFYYMLVVLDGATCAVFIDEHTFGDLQSFREIPTQVRYRCEWGHDDDSLKVENLPRAPQQQPKVDKRGQMDLI